MSPRSLLSTYKRLHGRYSATAKPCRVVRMGRTPTARRGSLSETSPGPSSAPISLLEHSIQVMMPRPGPGRTRTAGPCISGDRDFKLTSGHATARLRRKGTHCVCEHRQGQGEPQERAWLHFAHGTSLATSAAGRVQARSPGLQSRCSETTSSL